MLFFVPGRPVAKARPRFSNGHAYTPRRTLNWEQEVGWSAKVTLKLPEPLQGPLSVDLEFYGARSNADLDNLVKAVLDGMQGVVFENDRQVVELSARRAVRYDARDGVRVSVELVPELRPLRN